MLVQSPLVQLCPCYVNPAEFMLTDQMIVNCLIMPICSVAFRLRVVLERWGSLLVAASLPVALGSLLVVEVLWVG